MDSDSINIILWWTALVLGLLVFICFKYISWQRQTGRTAITKLLEEYFNPHSPDDILFFATLTAIQI